MSDIAWLRRQVLGLLMVGLALCACHASAQANDELVHARFAPEKDYGPFVYQDNAGKVKGLSIDILALISKTTGLQVESIPAQNLSDILRMAQRGEVDLVSSLRPTPERAQYLSFSRPYVTVPAVLVMRSGMAHQGHLETLENQPVGVGKGYAVEAFVRAKFPKVQWVSMQDDATALRALQDGRLQAVVADVASVAFVTREQHLATLQIHGPVGFEYPLSFAFLTTRQDIGEALERGLRAMRPDARDAAIRQWINVDEIQFRDTEKNTVGMLAVLAAVLALSLFAISLLRSKKKRGVP
jgi:ABC-type amino acid transport substrate-binding protein